MSWKEASTNNRLGSSHMDADYLYTARHTRDRDGPFDLAQPRVLEIVFVRAQLEVAYLMTAIA